MTFRLIVWVISCAAFVSVTATRSNADGVVFSQLTEVAFEGRLQSVAWQPSGDLLLFSGEDGVYVYSANFELVAHPNFVDDSFAISSVWGPDGERAASLMHSGNVIVWQVEDGRLLDTWQVRGIPLTIAWSPDGTKIAVGSDVGFGVLTVYDTNTESKREALTGDSPEDRLGGTFGGITSITWHPNSRWVAFGASPNSRAIVWDVVSNQRIRRIQTERSFLVALNPEGTAIVLAGIQDSSSFDDFPPQPMLYIWPIESECPEITIPINAYGDFDFGALVWQSQGRFLAAYNLDNQIRIWDSINWQLVAQLPAIRRDRDWPTFITQNSLAWSPDGTMLVDAGDRMFRVWGWQ